MIDDLSSYDYQLPGELVAQFPAQHRDGSRMLVCENGRNQFQDMIFADFPSLLREGDLLVVNDSRVFPARITGQRAESGGKLEVLFVRQESPGCWLAMTRCGGKLRCGEKLLLGQQALEVRVQERRGEQGDLLLLPEGLDLLNFLEKNGQVPLPPYIRRENPTSADDLFLQDRQRYQTVYAGPSGAVAAPTAGLHFTDHILDELKENGVKRTALTLHVGPGTFRPVKALNLADHRMHSEWYSLSEQSAELISETRSNRGRVVAVGTTVVRVLESLADQDASVSAGSGWTDIFIRPPYKFRVVEALLTNFHLPRSTLLMLVAAFAGKNETLNAYAHAVEKKYRFYSYGDCCFFS
jgi:S-adenosylmethionine:tRNA ribosyltransferase-isomerase